MHLVGKETLRTLSEKTIKLKKISVNRVII